MRTEQEIKQKIDMLSSSLEDYVGDDEYTASRHGKRASLKWVLGLIEDLTTSTWE